MLRSLYAGVTGLRAQQTSMDVIGDNIANVTTPGFKSSRVSFEEALAQTQRGAAGFSPDAAGTNPLQLGLGVMVGGTETVFEQGPLEQTARDGDLAIEGDGFFVVDAGGEQRYTRDGSFGFDGGGTLTDGAGNHVLGWSADLEGDGVDMSEAVGPITIPGGLQTDPTPTSEIGLGGNLDAEAEDGASATASISVYDSLGRSHSATFVFTKDDTNSWEASVEIPGEADPRDLGTVAFDANGAIDPASSTAGADGGVDADGTFLLDDVEFDGAAPQDITVDLDGDTALTQIGGSADLDAYMQDGNEAGALAGIEFGGDGSIVARMTNGESTVVGQIAMATFDNPEGLQREGENLYAETVNTGEATITAPGEGAAGTLTPGALEMSNVDLAREFTDLIVAQRAFQANTRGITTGDQTLQELVNMAR